MTKNQTAKATAPLIAIIANVETLAESEPAAWEVAVMYRGHPGLRPTNRPPVSVGSVRTRA
jgi:hypothetical protein